MIEPTEAGGGFEFVNEIKGGVDPDELHPGGREGRRTRRCSTARVAGYPVKGVRVRLVDGSVPHRRLVGDGVQDRRLDGVQARRWQQAEPGAARADHAAHGDVPEDVRRRRDRRPQLAPRPPARAWSPRAALTEIKAEVPMAEMLAYAPDLRSITGGRGDYTMEFLRYEEVPAHLAQKVVAADRRTADARPR